MRRSFVLLGAVALLTFPLPAQEIDTRRIYQDALVLQRIMQVSKKDVPKDTLKAIATETLEAVRGPRTDATYRWASHEREAAGTVAEGFEVEAGNKQTFVRFRGDFVYRLTIHVPSRRYVVRRNQKLLIERIDYDITPVGSEPAVVQSVEVNEWMEPGAKRDFELPAIAKVARITVTARTPEKAGQGGIELILTKAKLVDDPRSPYARTVENLKSFLQRVEKGDKENLQTLSNLLASDPALVQAVDRISQSIGSGAAPGSTGGAEAVAGLSRAELYIELQTIQDLLTGTPDERLRGMESLQQLARKVRPARQ